MELLLCVLERFRGPIPVYTWVWTQGLEAPGSSVPGCLKGFFPLCQRLQLF